MSHRRFYPNEIRQIDLLIKAVLENPTLLTYLLKHDADLHRKFSICDHTRRRLLEIEAQSLESFCRQLHGLS